MKRGLVFACALVVMVGLVVWMTLGGRKRKSAPPGESPEISRSTSGPARGLEIRSDGIRYCDTSGEHIFDGNGKETSVNPAGCGSGAQEEHGCDAGNMDVLLRSPESEPNDVLVLPIKAFLMKGRVQSCAASDGALAVATTENVVIIDSTTGAVTEVGHDGADEVALSDRLVAWIGAKNVRAVRRASK